MVGMMHSAATLRAVSDVQSTRCPVEYAEPMINTGFVHVTDCKI